MRELIFAPGLAPAQGNMCAMGSIRVIPLLIFLLSPVVSLAWPSFRLLLLLLLLLLFDPPTNGSRTNDIYILEPTALRTYLVDMKRDVDSIQNVVSIMHTRTWLLLWYCCRYCREWAGGGGKVEQKDSTRACCRFVGVVGGAVGGVGDVVVLRFGCWCCCCW